MTRSVVSIVGVLLFAFVAAAQDYTKMETFLGYTYARANSASNVPAFNMNGGGGQYAYNLNKWVSGVADLGASHSNSIGNARTDTTIMTALVGPRMSLRYKHIRPYFEVLFGVAHLSSSAQVEVMPVFPAPPIYIPGSGTLSNNGEAITTRVVTSQTPFAMTAGGGLDIKINKWVSFRPIGLDYMLTRFQNLRSQNDNNQNSLRYTTGFNFTFGGEQ